MFVAGALTYIVDCLCLRYIYDGRKKASIPGMNLGTQNKYSLIFDDSCHINLFECPLIAL